MAENCPRLVMLLCIVLRHPAAHGSRLLPAPEPVRNMNERRDSRNQDSRSHAYVPGLCSAFANYIGFVCVPAMLD